MSLTDAIKFEQADFDTKKANKEAAQDKIVENSNKFNSQYLLSCFPSKLISIAGYYSNVKDYAPEYFCTAMLTALGVAIGNTHVLHLNNGYTAKANIFAMIVGNAGVNKSEPLKDALKPIQFFQDRLYEKYKQELEEYKRLDREAKEQARQPLFGKPMTSDSTIEGIAIELTKFKRGTLINADEIASFLYSLVRYNSNSESYYLSYYNGAPVTIDRATKDTLHITSPFLSIIGTIQPSVVDKMFSDKEDNGFYDRFLICSKEEIKIPIIKETLFNYTVEQNYLNVFERLLSFELLEEPNKVYYNTNAWEAIITWDNKVNASEMMKPECTETERSIRAKMRIYLHRFALIIQMANYACGETSESNYIEIDAVEKAIRLTEYYTHQAINKRIVPTGDKLKGMEKELYDVLPIDEGEFDRTMFMEAAINFVGMTEHQAKHFLDRNKDGRGKQLFKTLGRGKYCKL